MSLLEFVVGMTGHLAWPIALVTSVLTLRRPLLKILQSISTVKYGGAEVLFGQEIEQVKASVQEAALAEGIRQELPLSPRPLEGSTARSVGRIVQAWKELEVALADRIKKKTGASPTRPGDLLRSAIENGVLSVDQTHALQGLRVMRNLAVHGRDELDEDKVRDFIVLADAMITVLRMPNS